MVWERSKVPFCLYLLMGNLGISGICENVVLDVVAVSILRKSDMLMDVVVLFLEMSSSLSLFETTMAAEPVGAVALVVLAVACLSSSKYGLHCCWFSSRKGDSSFNGESREEGGENSGSLTIIFVSKFDSPIPSMPMSIASMSSSSAANWMSLVCLFNRRSFPQSTGLGMFRCLFESCAHSASATYICGSFLTFLAVFFFNSVLFDGVLCFLLAGLFNIQMLVESAVSKDDLINVKSFSRAREKKFYTE